MQNLLQSNELLQARRELTDLQEQLNIEIELSSSLQKQLEENNDKYTIELKMLESIFLKHDTRGIDLLTKEIEEELEEYEDSIAKKAHDYVSYMKIEYKNKFEQRIREYESELEPLTADFSMHTQPEMLDSELQTETFNLIECTQTEESLNDFKFTQTEDLYYYEIIEENEAMGEENQELSNQVQELTNEVEYLEEHALDQENDIIAKENEQVIRENSIVEESRYILAESVQEFKKLIADKDMQIEELQQELIELPEEEVLEEVEESIRMIENIIE